jgi:hypothetical protein
MADRPLWNEAIKNRLRFFFWLLIISVSLPPYVATGQAVAGEMAASIRLLSLDSSRFPAVTAALDVRDDQGRFIHDLQPFQLRMLEDERPQPVSELEELQPGALFITALNPGRSFAIRDGQGFSRYERLSQALQSWAAGLDSQVRMAVVPVPALAGQAARTILTCS